MYPLKVLDKTLVKVMVWLLIGAGVTGNLNSGQDTDVNKMGNTYKLTERHKILIREAYHLRDQLGPEIWPGWKNQSHPLLYKTLKTDFLIHHPDPPPDFKKTGDTIFDCDIWSRPNTDTVQYQAAIPVNSFLTAVITAPGNVNSVQQWVLKANHEFFHVFQHNRSPQRVVNPFVRTHADKHELNYPFPYDDPAVKSIMRLEAEEIFRTITDSVVSNPRSGWLLSYTSICKL